MSSLLKENAKQFLLLGVILLAIALVYFYFIRTPATGSLLTTTVGTEGTSDEVLLLLLDLKKYQLQDLDLTVLADPIFQNLLNFRVELPPEKPGRPNPFAPLSGSFVSTPSININASFSR